MLVRDATAADFAPILALNEEWVHFLSPLPAERLELLDRLAAYHRVAVDDGGAILGFLLAFREGTVYDSPNYRWFSQRYESFLYIDRVVVSREAQGRGVGSLLYDDLFTFARETGVPLVTCEFYTQPPNLGSQRFHERYGFREVGTQTVFDGTKRVSLRVLSP